MASGFVSTSELEEARKRRQEEWEKARKPDDPIVAPEPEVCNKTLFEQLRDNKLAKEEEIAAERKLRDSIRGVDEDECDFLEQVDNAKLRAEKMKRQEEEELLRQMAQRTVRTVTEADTIPTTSVSNIVKPTSTGLPPKSKQAALLSVAIKRKSDSADGPSEKKANISKISTTEPSKASPAKSAIEKVGSIPGAIPGVGNYDTSSDSDSSDSEDSASELTIPTLQTSVPQRKQQQQAE